MLFFVRQAQNQATNGAGGEVVFATNAEVGPKRPRRVTKSEIAEVKRHIDIFGRQLLVNEKLVDADLIEVLKYIFDVLGMDYTGRL